MDKHKLINKLYDEYKKKYEQQQVVLGDGDLNCPIMMIGEAPGKDEVLQQRPFVGLAGGKLKVFIEYINKTRNDFYVTNAIKYRLYKVNEKTKRLSNRPAKVNEINENRPYLLKEIEIIKPKVVITLGNVPLKSIFGKNTISIGQYHGQAINRNGYILFPLYHPASLIYNQSLEEVYYKDLDELKKII